MDDSPGGKCESVIVFECMDLSNCLNCCLPANRS